jgi:Holliday junction resolvasome RuvABC endonuclease subunit
MNGSGTVIAGVDPGLSKAGIVIIRIPPNYEKPVDAHVRVADVFKSAKGGKKERRQDEDLMKRLRKFVLWYRAIFEEFRPRILVSESLSYPRNARSSAMLAMSWGSIQTYCTLNQIATFIFRPQEIKEGCGLAKNASKKQVEAKIRETWKFPGWPEHGQREHAFDAAGAVLAFLNDENWATTLLGV